MDFLEDWSVVLTLIQAFQVLYFTEGELEFIENRYYEEDERLSMGLTLFLKILKWLLLVSS